MDDRTKELGLAAADDPADPAANIDFDSSAASAEPVDNPLEHELAKPIQAHGEELRVLKWREPTGFDIERAGNPIVVDFFADKPGLTFNEKKMSAMISLLCAIPPSSVRQLTAGDWNSIAWKLVRFFMPRVAG